MGWTNPFTEETLRFLGELATNNRREWFQENKGRYEDVVKEPALRLISDFGPELRKVSPHFTAIPKATRGSLMRIYRDTRFSKDKRPYKTNVGIRFPHVGNRDVHAPGFYLHVEPGECFFGVGAWKPDRETLAAFRTGIVDDPDGWAVASRNEPFRAWFELVGESLKRPPRGFDPDHPEIEDLKRKDFLGLKRLEEAELIGPRLLDLMSEGARRAAPFVGFLCGTVGADF